MNTQNIELNKIKAKIKALASKTIDAGCTEHEASEAMAMVGRLLAQYNLSMSEIDVREQVCKTIYIKAKGQRRGAIDGTIIALADLVHAKVWFSSSYDTKWKKVVSYAFFGQEDDLELVKYLYDVIDSAIEHETESFKSSDEYRASRRRKTATVSFGHGMASRISYRLRDLRRKNDAELRKAQEAMDQTFEAEVEAGVATTTQAPSAGKVRGTALVVLKGQLIDAEFKKEGVKLRKAYGSHRANDSEAYYKGHAAGDKVNLSRPIGGGSKNSGYLS